MTPSPITCPHCGAPVEAGAPGGLCPRCLMAGAMHSTAPLMDASAQPSPSLDEVGRCFPQLEILEMVGHGGMGWVFKARQPKLDRLVALKLLPASLAERDPAFAGRFEREGQLLARLHHPNIVAVHDSGATSGFFYLLMEFVDGVNLRQAMASTRFTPGQALAIVPHICVALQYAHDEGVLHRDIKPENILLDAKGRVKLVDFGIAKLIGNDVSDPGSPKAADAMKPVGGDPALTLAGTTLGTPSYMAPEQRDTPGDVDHRADIYSLGVVFYELLTGQLPIGTFAPPSSLSASDPRVDAIVQQALEKERSRRQRSAGEVKTQVETVAQQRPVPIPAPVSTWPHEGLGAAAFICGGLSGLIPTIFYWLAPWLSIHLSSREQGAMFLLSLVCGLCGIALGFLSLRSSMGKIGGLIGLLNSLLWISLFFVARSPVETIVVQPSPSPAPGESSFIPAVQRTLNFGDSGTGCFSLDQGEYVTVPPEVQLTSPPLTPIDLARIERWLAPHEVDIMVERHNDRPQLVLVDTIPCGFQSSRFDFATAQELEHDPAFSGALTRQDRQPLSPILPENFPDAPTVAFQTRNGLIGLIQVMKAEQGSRQITFRYKVIHRAERTGPPFVARMAKGTVALLALAPHPSKNMAPWFADGSPAPKPFPGEVGQNPAAGKTMCEIALRVSCRNGSPSDPVLRLDTGFMAMGATSSWDDADHTAMTFTQALACPLDASQTNLQVGVAMGPWQDVFAIKKPVRGAPVSGLQADSWEAGVETTDEMTGQCAVAYHYTISSTYETRLIYVKSSGGKVPLHGRGTQSNGTLRSGIDLIPNDEYRQIKEFKLEKRPYHWVTFRQVSLLHGHRTAAQSVDADTDLLISQIAPANATAPGITPDRPALPSNSTTSSPNSSPAQAAPHTYEVTAAVAREGDAKVYLDALGSLGPPVLAPEAAPDAKPTGEFSVLFDIPEDLVQRVVPPLQAGKVLPLEVYDRTRITKLGEGTLVGVDNQINATTGTLRCHGKITARTNQVLLANMFVNLRLLIETKHGAVLVPKIAVQDRPEGPCAYVIQPDDTVTLRRLRPGVTEGESMSIEQGISAGDKVVLNPSEKMQDGDHVRYQPVGTPTAPASGPP